MSRDPIAGAYFRELAPDEAQAGDPAGEARATDDLVALLADAGALGTPLGSLPLLASSSSVDGEPERTREAPSAGMILRAALERLAADHPVLWSQRTEELSFVGNAVLAAGRNSGRAHEARAALEAAGAMCNLGLELQLKRGRRADIDAAADVLRRVPIDRLFRVGSARAFVDVSLPARRALAQRCARYAPGHTAALNEAIGGDELGDWPDAIDAATLRLPFARLQTLRGLAEAIPRAPDDGFISTRAQLLAAVRALRPRVP